MLLLPPLFFAGVCLALKHFSLVAGTVSLGNLKAMKKGEEEEGNLFFLSFFFPSSPSPPSPSPLIPLSSSSSSSSIFYLTMPHSSSLSFSLSLSGDLRLVHLPVSSRHSRALYCIAAAAAAVARGPREEE